MKKSKREEGYVFPDECDEDETTSDVSVHEHSEGGRRVREKEGGCRLLDRV